MTRIQIELPDATAQAAQEAGLLTPEALARLLNDALRRRQAAQALLLIADRVAGAGIAPTIKGSPISRPHVKREDSTTPLFVTAAKSVSI